MRCDACQGTGWINAIGTQVLNRKVCCHECMGSGVAHCCDGLCEQPSELRWTGVSGDLYAPVDLDKDRRDVE